jgi:hypothetical protein
MAGVKGDSRIRSIVVGTFFEAAACRVCVHKVLSGAFIV